MAKTMRSQRFSRWIAWGLLSMGVVLGIFGTVVLKTSGCPNPYDLTNFTLRFMDFVFVVPPLSFTVLGALIITYRPENRIGWLALFVGLTDLLLSSTLNYGVCSHLGFVDLPQSDEVLWLFNIFSFLSATVTGLFLMTFPDGHFLSSRWRRLMLMTVGLMAVFAILAAVIPGQLLSVVPNPAPDVQNPFGLSLLSSLFWKENIAPRKEAVYTIFVLLGIVSIFLRWRRAEGDVRQQIKWVAFFLLTAGMLFFTVELIGATVYPSIFDTLFYRFVPAVFFVGFPIVFGLSIFKYRLYDIDIIIRRTLVYTLVTLALLVVYFGSVILLQRLFSGITGQQSPLAIVLSTLLIAALFSPLRHRVQTVIDRRFYRKKYDAQQVLEQFAQSARDETDRDVLTTELARVLRDTMQPEHLSIWVHSDDLPSSIQNAVE